MTPESDAIATVASLMALAARTAPKGKGIDTLTIRIVQRKEKDRLATEMENFGREHDLGFFIRDAANVKDSAAVVLIGCNGAVTAGIDCGGCGYPGCAAMAESVKKNNNGGSAYAGPNCVIRMADLGIAVGSAAKTASMHNADNRVMYSAGAAARGLGFLGRDCTVAYGIPLSATGKNIFFDRRQ